MLRRTNRGNICPERPKSSWAKWCGRFGSEGCKGSQRSRIVWARVTLLVFHHFQSMFHISALTVACCIRIDQLLGRVVEFKGVILPMMEILQVVLQCSEVDMILPCQVPELSHFLKSGFTPLFFPRHGHLTVGSKAWWDGKGR